MRDPNAKMMPDSELPEFMQSLPRLTATEVFEMQERDLQRRMQELLAKQNDAGVDVDARRKAAAGSGP